MRPFLLCLLGLVLTSVLAVVPAVVPTVVPATTLEYPSNYAKNLVQYAVSERPDGIVRKMYVSHSALEALGKGATLPIGTLLVIEEFEGKRLGKALARDLEGHLIPDKLKPNLDVRRKVANKPRDFENWQNERFDAGTGVKLSTNLADCWICHQSAEKADFTFTLPALRAYLSSGKLERHDCNLPERQLCAHDFDF